MPHTSISSGLTGSFDLIDRCEQGAVSCNNDKTSYYNCITRRTRQHWPDMLPDTRKQAIDSSASYIYFFWNNRISQRHRSMRACASVTAAMRNECSTWWSLKLRRNKLRQRNSLTNNYVHSERILKDLLAWYSTQPEYLLQTDKTRVRHTWI